MNRILAIFALSAVGATLGASPTMAQEYPKKQPIKIVVAANAGGGADVLARITGQFLKDRLGQTVIVENKAGASGSIATDYVSKAPADGYTLLFCASELAVPPAVRTDMPYKFDELTYLTRLFNIPPLMFGSPALQINSTAELVTYMKANPGKIKYGSTVTGAVVHLGMSSFESAAGVKGLHVPYTGIAPVYKDLLGGHVDITEAAPPFPEGIKVLGTVGSKRHPGYPDRPTLEEIGVKGATWDLWYGICAPPNLPKPVADRLIAELTAVIKNPEAIAKYVAQTNVPPDGLSGDDFKNSVVADYRKWKAVADRENIKLKD